MARTAVTLVELLVTIALLALLGAGALVTLAPTIRDRELREGARALHVYFNAARSEAAALNRPVGVMIQQYSGASGFAFSLVNVEVPPPYCGDTSSSRLSVSLNGFSQFTAGDSGWVGILRLGDIVRLNYQAGAYRISAADTDANGYLVADNPGWMMTPVTAIPKNYSAGVPFQVFRQPARAAGAALQLPRGVVVDLFASGVTSNEFAPVDGSPVTIMFSPDGSISRIYYADINIRPTSRVYLLIGRREKVSASTLDLNANWRDPTNLWLTVEPRSGQVTTCENLATDPAILDWAIGLPLARALAATGQSIGGR